MIFRHLRPRGHSVHRWPFSPRNGRNPQLGYLKLFSTSRGYSLAKSDPDKAETTEPLRILFCGSDSFSARSLKALYDESRRGSADIASIDVVCRKAKPVGRGLTELRDPLIKSTALELGLPVHQIDTFTGWSPPRYEREQRPEINLIVAVSIGLLVPPRILRGAKYGGINVHPSLLPDLKGPAPIHWTLLEGDVKTGVSLQTLHPNKFDEGIILDQTPYPGADIPNHEGCSFTQLSEMVSSMAAEMLVKNVSNRTVIPPYTDVGWARDDPLLSKRPLRRAPKLEPSHRQIDFREMTMPEILRRNRVLKPLWSHGKIYDSSSPSQSTRLIYDPEMYAAEQRNTGSGRSRPAPDISPGLPYALVDEKESISTTLAPLFINTKDGATLVIHTIKIPGTRYKPAAALAWKAKLMGFSRNVADQHLYTFHEPLEYADSINSLSSARS